ncbi:MAG: undecaprenyl/decaprenyl-phosphate alpha-N-acetylglucosaminyl 1-phosphate transferase [Chloroflexi bacterium]|nr:undecaprenyl/decaprenyl-phosphate alpha-N-acetylglucosaminyl 1-phosphate transferase [Chloroflexota bacterium]
MTTYLLIFGAALVLAIGATPLARRLALRLGIIDQPAARKLHRNPVPLLGGAAIYAAFLLAILIFGEQFRLPQLFSILVGASLVSVLGVWDDRRGLRPLLKLLGQVVAALILLSADVRIELFSSPVLNAALTVFWVVGITNALNLLDNMDGLSGGVAAVAAAFFLVLAASSGQVLVASLSAALLGACLGFLRYNFNPATIFMGDTGSLFLGFVLAALGIKLRFEGPTVITWMIPVLVLGVPIFDTTLVSISRLRRGKNPLTTPGKDHLSHRLVRLGMTHREAVMALYLICGAFGMAALFLRGATIVEAYIVGGVVAAAGAVALVRLERVPPAPATPTTAGETVKSPQPL